MMHFTARRHAIVFGAMPAITAALLLAQSNASAAVAVVMQQSQAKQPELDLQRFHNAIDHLNQTRQLISQAMSDIDSEDAGPVEAKDIDRVIMTLIDNNYLAATSPIIDQLKTQDLGQVLDSLDQMVADVTGTIMWARDFISMDGTDSHLGHTELMQQKVTDLVKFGRNLNLIVAATWRDHNNQPSFVIADKAVNELEQRESVAA
jgi:hypothetical protein